MIENACWGLCTYCLTHKKDITWAIKGYKQKYFTGYSRKTQARPNTCYIPSFKNIKNTNFIQCQAE